jgi:biotin carboxyl carrier protein
MKEYKYKINGMKFTVGVGELHGNQVQVEVNGTSYNVELDAANTTKIAAVTPQPKKAGAAPRTDKGEEVVTRPVAAGGSPSAVKSPLPGTIMSFSVNVGDTVNAGDTVCVLEAMKMENDIHAPKGGVVKQIIANVGDAVLEGADLMIIE